MKKLGRYILNELTKKLIDRLYIHEVNLERDLEQPDALQGYILTERSVDALRRVLSGIKEGTSNSWTLTSVYGTGELLPRPDSTPCARSLRKSAFAHYLASLCASSKSQMRSLKSKRDSSNEDKNFTSGSEKLIVYKLAEPLEQPSSPNQTAKANSVK